jgi:hypothetical protein
VLDWIKPILLVAVGVLILIDPLAGVVTLSLLLFIYLLLDTFGSFFMAYSMRPHFGCERYNFSTVGYFVITRMAKNHTCYHRPVDWYQFGV